MSHRRRSVSKASPIARRSLTSRTLDGALGARVFFKCENFQRMGAFKFRGAYNALSRLADEERQRGVLAFSSGNHAQAVALAGAAAAASGHHRDAAGRARRSSVAATEAMAPRSSLYDRATERPRDDRRAHRSEERGLDAHPALRPSPTSSPGRARRRRSCSRRRARSTCCSCPAAAAACSPAPPLAASALRPACRVIGVEPEAGDDGRRSFRAAAADVHITPTPSRTARARSRWASSRSPSSRRTSTTW